LLGNDPIEASVVGEIRTRREWYDYEAKYVDEDTELLIPAPIDAAQSRRARNLAIEAVRPWSGAGFARVDFLMDRRTGDLFVNEVNSLPGFTEGSMGPRLWEASGLPYAALLDRLIEPALERHREKSELETSTGERELLDDAAGARAAGSGASRRGRPCRAVCPGVFRVLR
jgi:D-alanine-D-alanine ligase